MPTKRAEPPQRWLGQFPFSVPPLGDGIYRGQFRTNSAGESVPDGDGELILTNGVRSKERFSCWWTLGRPGTVEYRFGNGWIWVGVINSPEAVGPLREGNTFLPGLTFEDAARRARDTSQPVVESPEAEPTIIIPGSGRGEDAGEGMKRILAKENLFLILAQVSADDFASCLQISASEIRRLLQNRPTAAQQPEVHQAISQFWRTAAEGVINGYQTDCRKARQIGLLDGNRRFLEVAVGAVAAEYACAKSQPSGWGGDFNFPFPKNDGLETENPTVSPFPATHYVWPAFPPNVLEQSVTANILPRCLKVPLENVGEAPVAVNDPPAALPMVLVPSGPGLVRMPGQGTNDVPWQPETPFYMGQTETSFGQMRLYARWADHLLSRKPDLAKWFLPIPATKQLVGDQNLPYTGVTVAEALSFCNWLSFTHGREPAYTRASDGSWKFDGHRNGFRLADESEWQYAARFGFDFLKAADTPTWREIAAQFEGSNLNHPLDRHLVNFSTTAPTGRGARAVDDPGAFLYPLGLRDLCGNAGELCQAAASTTTVMRWTVCGGRFSSMWAGAVMPWSRIEYTENANKDVGFRVMLPVPMDDFMKE